MSMIEESAERAADLARQLLGFARPKTQQVKPVCVQQVVHRVRRMVERTFDRNIKLEVSLGASPIWINSEPSHLEQAVLNLCLNARDAMPRGGRLEIEAGYLPPRAEGLPTKEQDGAAKDVSISCRTRATVFRQRTFPESSSRFSPRRSGATAPALGSQWSTPLSKIREARSKSKAVRARGRSSRWSCPPFPPRLRSPLQKLSRSSLRRELCWWSTMSPWSAPSPARG